MPLLYERLRAYLLDEIRSGRLVRETAFHLRWRWPNNST